MTDTRRESAIIAAVYQAWALDHQTDGLPQPTDVGVAVQDGQTPSQYAEGETLLSARGRSLDDLHEQIRVALEEARVYED